MGWPKDVPLQRTFATNKVLAQFVLSKGFEAKTKSTNRVGSGQYFGPLKRGSCRSTYGRNNAHGRALVCEQHNCRSFRCVCSEFVELHTLPEMMAVGSTSCSVTSDRVCNLLQSFQVGPLALSLNLSFVAEVCIFNFNSKFYQFKVSIKVNIKIKVSIRLLFQFSKKMPFALFCTPLGFHECVFARQKQYVQQWHYN